MQLDDAAQKVLDLLTSEFAFYAQHALTIVEKQSRVRRPFVFNPSQAVLHARVEKMRAEKGWVRIIVPKGRQQGVSTYVTGRGYWHASMRTNARAHILAHELEATKNLFAMIQAYQAHCPAPLRPKATVDAANELHFGRLDSRFSVGTARTRSGGRSATLTFFHGSEVGYWPSLKENLAAVGQALALAPGTEAYLESTANGHNDYYAASMLALKGLSDFELCFLPWFLEPSYVRRPEPGFELSEEEWEYMDVYGLSLPQMAWRRAKIATDMQGDSTLFDQEYPASFARAFRRTATDNPFIRNTTVEKARRVAHKPRGPKRLGIDPSQGSNKGDRFMFVERDDAGAYWKHRLMLSTDDAREAAGACARIILERNPDVVFIDRLGIGAGICDLLQSLVPIPVIGVKASETAANEEKYANKRVEMWGEARDWLLEGASLLDDDELEADLTGPGFTFRGSQYLLESKEKMAKRDLPSPDCGDALAHTFYLPWAVARDLDPEERRSGAARNWKVT